VVAQVAFRSQPPAFSRHSFTSTQPSSPVPVYPLGQGPQVQEPGVFVQSVSGSQPPFPVRHSSLSVHVSPSPVQPRRHVHLR